MIRYFCHLRMNQWNQWKLFVECIFETNMIHDTIRKNNTHGMFLEYWIAYWKNFH